MSKRIIELFLFDILIAALKIEHVSAKYERADALKHDFVSWDSVIREFEIIGEAAKNLTEPISKIPMGGNGDDFAS